MRYAVEGAKRLVPGREVDLRVCGSGKKQSGGTVLLVLVLAFALLVAAGCGEDEDTDTANANTETTDDTATATAAETPEEAVTTIVTTPCPETTAPAAGCKAVEFVSLAIDKADVNEGDMITFTAEIRGDAKNVSVVFGKAGGDVSSTLSISGMIPVGTSGGVTTWQTAAFAPPGAEHLGGGSSYTGFAISQDDVQTRYPTHGTYTAISP